MKSLIGFLLAIASLVVVLVVVEWERTELTSPGPLHGAHRVVEELQGASGCAKCHSGADRDLAGGCVECHEPIAEQLAATRGLHGALTSDLARDCGHCHIEHIGDDISLVGEHAFQRAGIEERDDYDHAHVPGFDLAGRHVELACSACHERADVAVLERGQFRFLGLSRECTSCHEDPHRREFGSDCASCHGQSKPFDVVAEFAHDERFPLVDGHAGLTCAACHGPGSLATRSIDRAAVRACAQCHEDPHAADAREPALRIVGTHDCASCHDTVRFDAPRFDVDDHASVAFALVGKHRDVSCAVCHGVGSEPSRWSRSREGDVAAKDCAACHDSPHRESFVDRASEILGTSTRDACAACHDFDAATFALPAARLDAEVHAASGFDLIAPHAEVACAACHGERLEPHAYASRFPGRLANECAACHEDPHAGQFVGTACVECHSRTHFFPAQYDVASHARTDFPLDGAHVAIACRACHQETAEGARAFRGLDTDCQACHDDPHAGRFDAAGMPSRLAGRVGCARCHGTDTFHGVSWSPDDHRVWTGCELVGAHADTSCASCHGSPFGDAPRACAACHEDVHRGQFREHGATDCARCHDAAKSWRDLAFDHARDTRFRLDENHARLACSDCHVERLTRNGERVVRYRPLGRECGDCHATGR